MSMLRKSALVRAAVVGFGLLSMMAAAPLAIAATSQAPLKEVPGGFSFDSPLGKFDQASLHRG